MNVLTLTQVLFRDSWFILMNPRLSVWVFVCHGDNYEKK